MVYKLAHHHSATRLLFIFAELMLSVVCKVFYVHLHGIYLQNNKLLLFKLSTSMHFFSAILPQWLIIPNCTTKPRTHYSMRKVAGKTFRPTHYCSVECISCYVIYGVGCVL